MSGTIYLYGFLRLGSYLYAINKNLDSSESSNTNELSNNTQFFEEQVEHVKQQIHDANAIEHGEIQCNLAYRHLHYYHHRHHNHRWELNENVLRRNHEMRRLFKSKKQKLKYLKKNSRSSSSR